MSETEIEVKPAKKSAKPAVAEKVGAFEMPKFELPKFDVPKFEMPKLDFAKMPQIEVPPVFREMAEKGVEQAKQNYEKLKVAAEEATDMIEDTYETARSGLVEYNLKALDAMKANTDAVFGFAKDLASVKTFAEAVELQTAFVRKQFESVTAQAKDLQAVAQKVATETSQPVKDVFSKTFKAA
ncbi:phasin [Prosthecomicrobium sp. N25]|uniref:phasin n=1 Tax=Prosthecomicrobium sp. N25 TaxID=3129254 RepID=UPI0030780406